MTTIAVAQDMSPPLNDIYSKPRQCKFAMPWIWLTYTYTWVLIELNNLCCRGHVLVNILKHFGHIKDERTVLESQLFTDWQCH